MPTSITVPPSCTDIYGCLCGSVEDCPLPGGGTGHYPTILKGRVKSVNFTEVPFAPEASTFYVGLYVLMEFADLGGGALNWFQNVWQENHQPNLRLPDPNAIQDAFILGNSDGDCTAGEFQSPFAAQLEHWKYRAVGGGVPFDEIIVIFNANFGMLDEPSPGDPSVGAGQFDIIIYRRTPPVADPPIDPDSPRNCGGFASLHFEAQTDFYFGSSTVCEVATSRK